VTLVSSFGTPPFPLTAKTVSITNYLNTELHILQYSHHICPNYITVISSSVDYLNVLLFENITQELTVIASYSQLDLLLLI